MTVKSLAEVSESPGAKFEWLTELLLSRYRGGSKSPIKVGVVMGAGCSVWSGLETWNEKFKNELIEAAGTVFRSRSAFVKECWRSLSDTIGFHDLKSNDDQLLERLKESASIEDIAGVALKSAVAGDAVYELLTTKFTAHDSIPSGFQPPQLGYELLAHFLKHGFVDHLLTFNFDELLDEAVSNELGKSEFELVTSDHDVLTNPRVWLPHVVKMHGTLGRPATLRFTRTATSALPQPMVRLLDQLLLDVDPPPSDKSRAITSRYLVSLGYGWHDRDMLHWLHSRHSQLDGMLVLCRQADLRHLTATFATDRGWEARFVRYLTIEDLCKATKAAVTVDVVLWALWSHLEHRMANVIPHMPASRHIILGYLFGPRANLPGQSRNQHEPLNRFVVEFILHLAKCKGMVNLSTMTGSDRISRYYAHVRRTLSQDALGAGQDLVCYATAVPAEVGTRGGGRPIVRQASYPDVKETYYALAETTRELATHLTESHGFDVAAESPPIYEETTGRISRPTPQKADDFIAAEIQKIFDGPEIEVGRRSIQRESWSLRHAEPLLTYVDLQTHTLAVLQQDWTHLLVIAESGEWLTKLPMSLEKPGIKREVVLIEARQPPEHWPLRKEIDDTLRKHWDGLEDVQLSHTDLSWWQHNRHLTLALTRNEASEFVCLGGIYFRRRHKASRIQPLYLDGKDPDDVAELLLTVLAYARRSLEELATPNGVALARKVIEIAVAMADKGTASERIAETVRVLRAAIAKVEAEGPGGN